MQLMALSTLPFSGMAVWVPVCHGLLLGVSFSFSWESPGVLNICVLSLQKRLFLTLEHPHFLLHLEIPLMPGQLTFCFSLWFVPGSGHRVVPSSPRRCWVAVASVSGWHGEAPWLSPPLAMRVFFILLSAPPTVSWLSKRRSKHHLSHFSEFGLVFCKNGKSLKLFIDFFFPLEKWRDCKFEFQMVTLLFCRCVPNFSSLLKTQYVASPNGCVLSYKMNTIY